MNIRGLAAMFEGASEALHMMDEIGDEMITENPRRFIVYSCTLCDFNSLVAKEAADHNCPLNPDDMSANRFDANETLDRIERVAFPSDLKLDSLRRDIAALRAYITGRESS